MSETAHYKIIFFGTPDFAVPILNALAGMPKIELTTVVTQTDKPVGRKQILTPPPVKITAQKNNITVLQPEKIKTAEFEKQLRELKPTACLVAAYGNIIPAALLAIPPRGWLNVHASLLPLYRGASPIQAVLLAGDDKTGITLMRMEASLDTGPIISQRELPISARETFVTLHDKLSRLGAELIRDTLLDYLSGQLTPAPQDSTRATKTSIIKKEDGLINWTKPSTYLDRHIRAYTPWPGAYTYWNKRRLKILDATSGIAPCRLTPGQLHSRGKDLVVGCGTGALYLKTIQLEGKKPSAADALARGYPALLKAILS